MRMQWRFAPEGYRRSKEGQEASWSPREKIRGKGKGKIQGVRQCNSSKRFNYKSGGEPRKESAYYVGKNKSTNHSRRETGLKWGKHESGNTQDVRGKGGGGGFRSGR